MHDREVASYLESVLRPQKHKCTSKCSLIQLKIQLHQKDGKFYVRWSKGSVLPWMCEDTLVRRIYNIYACRETRSVHYCHSMCDGEKIKNNDSAIIC